MRKITAHYLTAKAPYRTVESDGWFILIGRSAADNDKLSLEVALPNDLWLHVENYPGSHVVIRNPDHKEVPESVINTAAKLAVENSRAKGLTGVSVVIGKAGDLTKPENAAVGEINISKFDLIKVAAAPAAAPPADIQYQKVVDQVNFWYKKINGPALERAYGLKPGILKFMIEKESKGDNDAESHRGARGLFQIMPPAQSGFHGDPTDPFEAASYTAETLARNYQHFGCWQKTLAAWNWGRGNVIRKGLEKIPTETKRFLDFFRQKGIH